MSMWAIWSVDTFVWFFHFTDILFYYFLLFHLNIMTLWKKKEKEINFIVSSTGM